MMNVLIIHRDFDSCGGILRCFEYLAKGSINKPVRFHFGSLEPSKKEIISLLNPENSKIVILSDKEKRGGLSVIPRIRKYIKNNNIDLTFCCCFRAYLLAKLATNLSKRVIFWAHGSNDLIVITPPKILKKVLFRMLLNHQWLVCNSFYTLSSFASNSRPRSRVVYNGVSPIKILSKEYSKNKLGVPQHAKVLTNVSEYAYWKDHRTLLSAFKKLAELREDLYLLLCGRFEIDLIEKDLLYPILGKSALRSRIFLLGSRSDMPLILSATDVYVHPCFNEGFGNIVAEAMIAGIPVVAADAGALPELVKDTGILFSPRNPSALSNAIDFLLSNEALMKELGKKAKARAIKLFSNTNFASRFLQVCSEIIKALELNKGD